ncbi:MAG: nuclear transport factor 2 family protein [Hyphomonadaceae bacterium]
MTDPTSFAAAWIADRNAHDVEKILAHYAQDVVFHSPKVAIRTKDAKTFFTGREELRPYFSFAFQIRPQLQFTLLNICQDKQGLALIYQDETGATATELMDLNEQGQVRFARVLYDR